MNRLPLSAKGMNPATAHDYSCDYPGCTKRAMGYLFMSAQFCGRHRRFFYKAAKGCVPDLHSQAAGRGDDGS